MKRKNLYICVAVIAVISIVGVGVGMSHGVQSPAGAAAAPADAAPSSVAVILQPVQRKEMSAMLTAYGDVAPGVTQAVSSAYAAQIVSLHVMQGQTLKKGAPLMVLSADPASRLAYEQAQSALRLADAELVRQQSLLKLQLATQSQLETAQKTRDDAAAALQSQLALGGGDGSRIIRAPADGVVVALTALQGDRVQAGAPILQFGATDGMKIVLGIDPADQALVRKGAAARITALTQGASSIDSVVGEVQNLVDPKTQLINVVVRIPAEAALSPGMRVRAEIATERRQAFEVPRQAVLNDAQGDYLFQVRDGLAHRVAVRKLVDNRTTLGVAGELDPQLPLIVLGNYELQDGMAVRKGPQ